MVNLKSLLVASTAAPCVLHFIWGFLCDWTMERWSLMSCQWWSGCEELPSVPGSSAFRNFLPLICTECSLPVTACSHLVADQNVAWGYLLELICFGCICTFVYHLSSDIYWHKCAKESQSGEKCQYLLWRTTRPQFKNILTNSKYMDVSHWFCWMKPDAGNRSNAMSFHSPIKTNWSLPSLS